MHRLRRRSRLPLPFPTCALCAGLLALGLAPGARATDVGLPVYSASTGRVLQVEAYFEQLQRNIRQDYLSGTDLGTQKEDRYVARISYRLAPRVVVQLDAGAAHAEAAEGAAPLVGLGLKLGVADGPLVEVTAFAAATYVYETKYTDEGFIDTSVPGAGVEEPTVVQTESYLELSGGFLFSRTLPRRGNLAITPYGGVMVSGIGGDEDYELRYRVSGDRTSSSGDLLGDGPLSLFGGLGVRVGERWGVRLEGRFVNQTSVSAGLSCTF